MEKYSVLHEINKPNMTKSSHKAQGLVLQTWFNFKHIMDK